MVMCYLQDEEDMDLGATHLKAPHLARPDLQRRPDERFRHYVVDTLSMMLQDRGVCLVQLRYIIRDPHHA